MEGLILNIKEQKRIEILNKVLEDVFGVGEAARVIGVSERHLWRLLSAYRKEGAKALVHGNRGRKPINTILKEEKEKVVELALGEYKDFNHCHLTELLAEREGLVLCRSTVRRILLSEGIKSPRKRRQPRHRCRRERCSQEGMLLQIDGSKHDWLEGRGPYLTLVGAVDDTTGTVPYALFRNEEDAQGYFMLLSGIIKNKGIPLALYTDRHGIFQRSTKELESLEEQLLGRRQPTQFGRSLQELGIQPIFAMSPQAKGRIERLWGTFQDRLVSELRLAGASTVEEADRLLRAFLPRFNTRFGVPPAQAGSAYRQLPTGLCMESILCFKYERTVAADNTIHFNSKVIQLLPGLDRTSYAHAHVEVQERLDGSLVVSYHGCTIATQEAPPNPVSLRARKGLRSSGVIVNYADRELNRINTVVEHPPATDFRNKDKMRPNQSETDRKILQPYKPPINHPWRKYVLTKSLNG